MRKILLASAFALFGTFAMANETETEDKQDAPKQGVESLALEAPDVEHHPLLGPG